MSAERACAHTPNESTPWARLQSVHVRFTRDKSLGRHAAASHLPARWKGAGRKGVVEWVPWERGAVRAPREAPGAHGSSRERSSSGGDGAERAIRAKDAPRADEGGLSQGCRTQGFREPAGWQEPGRQLQGAILPTARPPKAERAQGARRGVRVKAAL